MDAISSLMEKIPDRTGPLECTGLSGTERSYFFSRICRHANVPVVAVLPSIQAANRFCQDLQFFLPAQSRSIMVYPAYNILPHKHVAYHNETAAQRIAALYRLACEDPPPVVITTAGALTKKVLPRSELLNFAELVQVDEEIDRDQLIEKLVSSGYFHTSIVEEPGDFSIRGGILDVFPPLTSNPLRIECFGDTVDTIRLFDAGSQLKIRDISEAVLLPARESIVGKSRIEHVVGNIRIQAAKLDLPVRDVRELVRQVRDERVFPGIESLLSVIYPELDTFFDYAADPTLFVCFEPGDLEKAANLFHEQVMANHVAARNDATLCVDPESLYLSWSTVRDTIAARRPVTVKTLAVSKAGTEPTGAVTVHGRFEAADNTTLRADLDRFRQKDRMLAPLMDWIRTHHEAGCVVCMVCRTRSQIHRMQSLLDYYGIDTVVVDGLPKLKSDRFRVFICRGELSAGFVWQGQALAIVTAEEILGTSPRAAKKVKTPARAAVIAFSDLKQNDLVVHTEHGIGQYEGLAKLTLNRSTNDFLLILYKDQDKLYLPVDRMNMIQKYMGVDDVVPVLSKMGGKAWERVKNRVKKSAEKIAGELLKIYAARQVRKGHAFGTADEYFRDFEADFPYEETEDQFKAIVDVLADMENPVPMDRLVCGDVGYGKTEVALRAAFKSVSDNKQVAVLVPTTVLAEQHFRTFSERFDHYAVQVACLTRFRSPAKQRDIVKGMKDGSIDVVIGTHRLLQKDIGFKDIGLLIFDEEHRFGVKHKERLKSLKETVDVLALTATPIPRTLHLSLSGIRDISTITTPPEDRRAIITYICELDDTVIAEAIRKELNRKGQIFFIHNNIHSIWGMANRLQNLVPEVRLAVAHGRMSEDELEQVMLRFLEREIDMLVCTTIVESGLDIPSANSILINRADRLGLAQMYQLRGRVGRSEEQAFAYLFIPPESHLSKDAQKRLKVLMEHSDLGSGFQIAMSDLKIRGGGTILGASQSGHIAAVGYDMFLNLMEQAIAEHKGTPIVEPLSPEINVSFSAFIPESYIPDIDQRLAAYRRLAKMTALMEISEFKAELADRFGPIPKETTHLLLKIMLKVLAGQAGVKRLDLEGRSLSLQFSERHMKDPEQLIQMVRSGGKGFSLSPDHTLRVQLPENRRHSTLGLTRNILKEITQHGNG